MDVLRISLFYVISINFNSIWASQKQGPLSSSYTSLNCVLTATSSFLQLSRHSSQNFPYAWNTCGLQTGVNLTARSWL